MDTKPTKAPQITVDPATGRLMLDGQLLDRYDPRLWGRVGRNVLDVNTASGGAYGPEAYDPRYYEAYTAYDGDNGEVTRYRLRPEYAERLGNRTQLGQSGVGGHGEVNDPAGLVWDDEFGILVDRSNLNAPDDSGIQGLMANYIIPASVLAAMGYGAGSMAGLWGGGGVDLGTFGGLAPEEALGLTSADMVGGASGVGVSLEDLVLENFLTPAADVSLDAAPDIFSLTGGSNWAELGAGAGGLAPEEMGIANYLAGPGQAPGLWDTLSQYGGRFLDRLPALANAARYMIPSQQLQLGGGAPPGGNGGHIASAARGLGGGGQGGMGTSGVDMGKLKELLSLAAYLGGRR